MTVCWNMACKVTICVVLLILSGLPELAVAQSSGQMTALTVTPTPGGGESYSVTLQILVLMTVLTFLPAMLVMMTPFARVLVVLAILRQGLGTQQTPSNQILLGLSLFLTFFIMAPVIDQVYATALAPYFEEEITLTGALQEAKTPLQSFMMAQTRDPDLQMFAELAGDGHYASPSEVPFTVLVPAFVTSELKSAFQIGFLLLIPFLVIDLVVASVLMSMGMVMLSPLIISLPFKLMLFVLVDGWALVIGSLASSFYF